MGAIYDGGEEALSAYFDGISIRDVRQSIERGEGACLIEGFSVKEKEKS